MQKAYSIALESSNELKAEQKRLNSEYLAELQLEEIPKGTSDARKKEIEAYNKQKQIERGIELPPVYEPLKLNLDLIQGCELWFQFFRAFSKVSVKSVADCDKIERSQEAEYEQEEKQRTE